MAIHRKQEPEPTHPWVTIVVPANPEPSPTGRPPASAEPPSLAEGHGVEDSGDQAPPGGEYALMGTARLRTIWGLVATSLLPGAVATGAPQVWQGLPPWAHWTAYACSGLLIFAVMGLIVRHDGARK